jgi:hypothetical protein
LKNTLEKSNIHGQIHKSVKIVAKEPFQSHNFNNNRGNLDVGIEQFGLKNSYPPCVSAVFAGIISGAIVGAFVGGFTGAVLGYLEGIFTGKDPVNLAAEGGTAGAIGGAIGGAILGGIRGYFAGLANEGYNKMKLMLLISALDSIH